MANSKDIYEDVIRRITLRESSDEISQIAYLLLQRQFGVSRTDILLGKKIHDPDVQTLDAVIERINLQEPVQYILGEADFYGRKFKVNPSVLIPRPETEQLVEEVIKAVSKSFAGRALDIGTGSGCIAITLAKEITKLKLTAIDISHEALDTAKANASSLQAQIDFIQADFLSNRLTLPPQEIIVSNPPYIRPSEKLTMQPNVLAHEPQAALFVPEENPLIFYSAIAVFARAMLTVTGWVFVEINEALGNETMIVFQREGFTRVSLLKDLQGKDRIVVAQR